MKNNDLFKYKFNILILCTFALLLSGCKWFNNSNDQDTTPPVITLIGDNPQLIEMRQAYVELGANANDDTDGNITANIVVDASAVDTNTVGNYSVSYNVSDAAGNAAATIIRTVEVLADLTPPVITLLGDNPQVIEFGTAYTELGATANDNIDGDITVDIVINSSAVNTNVLGSYTVTYDVADAANNNAVTLTRTVEIVDTTIPVITLNGANPQTIDLDVAYTELGASATDNADGDISANIVINASAVDTSIEGNYSVTYDVTDASGNAASTVTRSVIVGTQATLTLFTADNGTTGFELYVTDGTEQGTSLLKDINLGANDSYPERYLYVEETLYFVASDDSHGDELWKSDGTEAGTVMVKDIYLGTSSANPDILTNVNGTLFFVANDGVNGIELWKSDGTDAGTVMVKDIRLGTSHSSPESLTFVNGILFFSADDGFTARELWKSDGTDAGTVMVKEISPLSADPDRLFDFNGTLYFMADTPDYGKELWKSDGTEVGTVMVKDIYPDTIDSTPANFYEFDGALYFTAISPQFGRELWKTDGTETGTVMVKDIYFGTTGSHPSYLASVGTTLYFAANDYANGQELWKTDGTEAGTVMVKNISSGNASSSPRYLVALNNSLLFTARVSRVVNDNELWISDGTDAGTVMLKDIRPGTDSSWSALYPTFNMSKPIILSNGKLLFSTNDGTHGYEPWTTDGTEQGTSLLKDLNPGTADGYPTDG